MQPKPEDYDYELDEALASVVGIRSIIPADAFTAETLGTERAGHGVLIRKDGLVLTIGYLITEAETVWISHSGGRAVSGPRAGLRPGDRLRPGAGAGASRPAGAAARQLQRDARSASAWSWRGAGGRQRAVAARIIAKQEFAGYWEYVLDEAIFTAPAHPNLGRHGADRAGRRSARHRLAADPAGRRQQRQAEDVNMIVPIDLLKPILDDLLTIGRPNRPSRPWLGLYATEVGSNVAILGLASRGPAQQADLRAGDIVLGVAGTPVSDLAGLFRRVWALGQAGVAVPLLINREGKTFEVSIRSSDRRRFLKGPVLH